MNDSKKCNKKGKTVYLLGYYLPQDSKETRYCSPAACAKFEYIANCLVKLGYAVKIISSSNTITNITYKKRIDLVNGYYLVNFLSVGYKHKLGKIFSDLFYDLQQLLYLLFKVPKLSTLVVYHSMKYMKFLPIVKKIKKLNIILEVEEVYSSVMGDQRGINQEMRMFLSANSYVFPSESLNNIINKSNKPSAIIYGPYETANNVKIEKFDDGFTHCVYAGTFNAIKGGCKNAIKAAEFLPSNIYVHILGFGNEEEIQEVLSEISDVKKKSKCQVSFDGKLMGEEFQRFLSKCHIGLSTQNPRADYNMTSFPSKVLTYLLNELTVVSTNIPVLKDSVLAEYIYFCGEGAPEEIAKVIVEASENRIDGKEFIRKLDEKAKRELKSIIEV